MRRALVIVVIAVVAIIGPREAGAGRPIGAAMIGGEAMAAGGGPTGRLESALTAYLTRRYGVYLGLDGIAKTDAGTLGVATAGVAFRATAARPTLEIVLHGDAGLAWGDGLAPALGGGVDTFLWPLKKLPLALVVGPRLYLIPRHGQIDVTLGFGLGFAIAR